MLISSSLTWNNIKIRWTSNLQSSLHKKNENIFILVSFYIFYLTYFYVHFFIWLRDFTLKIIIIICTCCCICVLVFIIFILPFLLNFQTASTLFFITFFVCVFFQHRCMCECVFECVCVNSMIKHAANPF